MALLGLYGVLTLYVRRRIREVGVRAMFIFAAVLDVLGSLAAAGFPALRAAHTDPARVLRDE